MWLSVTITGYFYKEILLFLITQIHENYFPNSFYFIFTNLIEIFEIYIKLILFFANQTLILYTGYHLFFFISPALFIVEYAKCYNLAKFFVLVWLLFLVFFNYVFAPFTWAFFLSFLNFSSINLYFEARLNEFIIFYISLYHTCFFYCTVFLILFVILSYININSKFIKKFRKLYYSLFIIFSTIISPPDIFSQFFLSLFVIVLYELLLFVSLIKLSN